MTFLAPAFLLAAFAVAAPILFHLIRRSSRRRQPFSSLLFLRPSPPRVEHRRRIEHPWLLLLRCLALLLLTAAFARPLFPQYTGLPEISHQTVQRLLLIDTSASMMRGDLWNQATSIAGQILDRAASDDRVAIFTFDQQLRPVVSFAEWAAWTPDQRSALARARLDNIKPRWMATRIGQALASAAEKFPANPTASGAVERKELTLITDLQEGASLDGLQGHDWPAGVRVDIQRVAPRNRGNAGLQILPDSPGPAADDAKIRVRVVNAADSDHEKFRLTWQSEDARDLGEPLDIYLAAGRSRTLVAPALVDNVSAAQLRLMGDECDFDNVSWYVSRPTEHLTVAYFGGDPASSPSGLRYYLERAFFSSTRRQVRVVAVTADSSAPATLNAAALVIVSQPLQPDQVLAVRGWIERGNTALVVLTGSEMAATLSSLTELSNVSVGDSHGDYALLGEIDFRNPLFAPFADPRFNDFSRIHFWKHRVWNIPAVSPAHVIARFDDGAPAFVEVPTGRGRLIVVTSGWNSSDSQLALSSKFPPLLETLLGFNSGTASARVQFFTGESIPAPVPSGQVQWRRPDGSKRVLTGDAPLSDTDLPGIYSAVAGDRTWRFAVNLPLDESLTSPLLPDDLARLGVPLQLNAAVPQALAERRQRHLQDTEAENRQKLWRGCIAATLAAVCLEILAAGRLTRTRERTAPGQPRPVTIALGSGFHS